MKQDFSYQHRWSGWPGAICMKCFAEDVRASCDDFIISCGCKEGCETCRFTGAKVNPSPSEVNEPCPAYTGKDPYENE